MLGDPKAGSMVLLKVGEKVSMKVGKMVEMLVGLTVGKRADCLVV